MKFEDAKKYIMRFGKYKDQALDEIAQTDEGLLYLDWLLGQSWVRSGTREALETYLGDEAITKEVQAAMQRRGS